jgi:DNA polymerase-3 subunit gamma/tau
LLELCSGKGKSINIALVNETAGIMGRGVSADTVKAILKKDIQRVFEIVGDITSASADLTIFFGELIEFYRDMLVIKSTKDAKAYLDLTDEEYKATGELCEHFTKEKLLHHIKSLAEAYNAMQRSITVKRVTAEMALVSLTDDRISVSPEALLSRIASLEEKLALGSFTASANETKKPESKAEVKSETETPKKAPNASLSALSSWAEIIETVERSDNFAAQMLKQSKGYTDGSKIIIKTSNSFSPTILGRDEVKALIATGINLAGDLSGITPDKVEITVEHNIENDDDPFASF